METDIVWTKADHTIVMSDLHLSDAESPHPRNPLWKRFKRRRYFIDRSFDSLLNEFIQQTSGVRELILNGDIFDFDSVLEIPSPPRPFRVSWLERRRGLNSEELKSAFKMSVILEDHPLWVQSLRNWVTQGGRIVFVIGNHDIELHWVAVQKVILDKLCLDEVQRAQIRFCEWFYISNEDSLIEHGNQYDAYCLCADPIHPLIRQAFKPIVRVPFGNLASRFMTNGMGLINPHAEATYVKDLKGWLVFFVKYVLRVQPFLLFTWFWTAIVTLVYAISEGLMPAMKDPLTVESRVESIAQKANGSAAMVRSLRELHAHPAIYNPFRILRELWLDRAFLLVLIIVFAFNVFSFMSLFYSMHLWVFILLVMIGMPLFVYYARSVKSEVYELQAAALNSAVLACQMARVKRAVHGHTHREMHVRLNDGYEVLNSGNWSPAFTDPECRESYGKRCFVWIQPNVAAPDEGRVAKLYEYSEGIQKLIESSSSLVTSALPSASSLSSGRN